MPANEHDDPIRSKVKAVAEVNLSRYDLNALFLRSTRSSVSQLRSLFQRNGSESRGMYQQILVEDTKETYS
jgi:hypothetical protein